MILLAMACSTMSLNTCSQIKSALRSPAFARAMILLAMAPRLTSSVRNFVNRAFEKVDRAAVLGRCAVEPEAMVGRAEIGAHDHVAPDRRVGDEHLAPVRSLLPDYGFLARVTHCCSTRGTCAARLTMKAL